MTSPGTVLNIPGAWLLTVGFTQAGQPAACVLGFTEDGAGAITDADAVAVRDAFWTAFRPCIAADTSCTGATLRQALPDGLLYEVGPPALAAGNNSNGVSSVAAYSALIKWGTALGGRSGKGRTYLPGVPSSEIVAGGRGFNTAFRTTVATAITNYFSATGPLDLAPAVVSRKDQSAAFIINGALASVPGIQRRRMRA